VWIHNTLALPVLLNGSETWTIKAKDVRRITAAEMKYMRRRAGYTWTDYKTNTQIDK
jgi:ABC-type ATPase involved in cell division